MEEETKSNAKCSTKVSKKDSLVIFGMSLVLFAFMIVRVEVVNRRAGVMEAKLEKRIQRIEEEMQGKVHSILKEMLQTERNPTTRSSRNSAGIEFQEILNSVSRQHPRERRNIAPTPGVLSLQQIRLEIDKKFTQACSTADKLCQTGQQGPKGEKGAHGYPGYKGEKGAPGKTGPRGPKGLTGTQGIRGKQGPTGAQGVKGLKGEVGIVGSRGAKGDTGRMGPPGEKGSIGFKGNKGNRGFTGIQGPKGECVVPPKIFVSPETQYVFLNKSATFYCWVQGQSFNKKINWRKLEGNVLRDISTTDGILHISYVQRSHTGSYLCTVVTSYGIFRAVTILGIKASPIFTRKPPPQVFAEDGSTVKLCCEADGHVMWSRSGTALASLPYFQQDGCLTIGNVNEERAGEYTCRVTNQFGISEVTSEVVYTGCTVQPFKSSYCHSGWLLIARFSNNDGKNWMKNSGDWWYDRRNAAGTTTDSSVNADMISPVFWLVKGTELKITRSDDSNHTPLLQTTGNCLGGQTFRSKITSYGDFRNSKVWSSDRCLGSCTVQYGGQYKTTDGFEQAECSSNIQSSHKIGFWCDWDGDGSVMMIGGGGRGCNRADHGIGITERDTASFILNTDKFVNDFGFHPAQGNAGQSQSSQSYSLNLWIR